VSPVANAIAIPVVSLAVVPLAIAGAFLPVPFLLDVAHAIMLALMSPLEWLAELPLAMLESHAPAAWTVIAAVAGCAWVLAPRGTPLRSLGLVWMAPMFAVAPPRPRRARRGSMCSTSATASRWWSAPRITRVYDTGPGWNADVDSGNRIVVPFLRGEGIRTLDGVVVSHADDDHLGGAIRSRHRARPRGPLSSLRDDDPISHRFPAIRALRVGPALDVGRGGVLDAILPAAM
jgi:competence protein ComEC